MKFATGNLWTLGLLLLIARMATTRVPCPDACECLDMSVYHYNFGPDVYNYKCQIKNNLITIVAIIDYFFRISCEGTDFTCSDLPYMNFNYTYKRLTVEKCSPYVLRCINRTVEEENETMLHVPMKSYYDKCPTPYRTETFDLQDFEFSTEGSRKRSPDNIDTLNHIIRNQGLHLTPRETQNIIKCAHLLGNVLSKAIERRSKANFDDSLIEDPEITSKKKNLTLDLKETTIPVEVKEEKKSETVTTQTDISLPNTKSAPRIFENILRQLSRSSIDVGVIQNKEKGDSKDKIEAKDKKDTKSDAKDKNEVKGKVNNQVKDKNEVKDKKDTKCDAKDKSEEKSKLIDQMKDKNEVTDKKNTKSDATDKNEVKSGVKNQVEDKSKVTGEVTEVKDQNEVKSEVKNEIENKPEVTEVKDKNKLKTDTKNKE